MYLMNEDKRCPICGKTFYVPTEAWVYKRRRGATGAFDYFCSYHCKRKKDYEIECKKKKVSTCQKGIGDEVVRMLMDGKTNLQICEALGVASGTVSYYKKRIGIA